MASISLTDGVALPETFEGLPRIATAVVETDVLAALYSDASPQSRWVDGEHRLVADPSGDALIVLFDHDGRNAPLPRFRIQSRWVVFAMLNRGWVVGRTAHHIATRDPHDTVVYDEKGVPVSSIYAGGAIEFLQSARDGSFWIGHDDGEWEDNAKRGGVSHFSAEGTELFNRDWTGNSADTQIPPEVDGMPFWCCYALNVVDRSAWTQHYTSMLITRFEPDGSAQSWVTERNGAVALAVAGKTIARIGRYDEMQYQISAFRLGDPPHADFIGRIGFDIGGERPKYQPWIDGKGETFHIVHDSKWYRITLDDILSHIGARNG